VIGDRSFGDRDRIVDPPTGPAPAAVSFALVLPIAPGTTSSAYALYYGDPTATAAPADGTKVFALYDDFANGIAPFWLTNDGPTTANGKLVLRGGHTDALTTNATTDNVPILGALEIVANVIDPMSNPTVQPEGTFFYWFGYQRSGDFSALDPWILWIARGQNSVGAEQKSPVGCDGGCRDPTSLSQDTASHYYAIERDPTATRFYHDGAMVYVTPVTNSADYSVIIRNYMATSDLQVSVIRARARVAPDPTVTIGSEEKL
jgi:hypothetical protein